MEYDVVIIGAGVAGLFAGLKLSCAGRRILIIEQQAVPGGFATTFKRKGFTFESAIHCVDALGPEGEIRKFLKEYGIEEKIEFIELEDFSRIIYPGYDFVADFKRDNFISYLKDNFPQENKGIDYLFKSFDKFYRQFDCFYHSKLPSWLNLALCPFIYPKIIQTSMLNVEQFISKYIKDERLKSIITDIWKFLGLPPSYLSAFYFLIAFRGYYYQSSAYIKGGFIQLFNAMVEKIRQKGSEVKFNTKAIKIITDNKRTVKTVLTDRGEEIRTKAIISNANAIDTLTRLLDDELFKKMYAKKLSRFEKSLSAFQVYLGLSIPAKNLGMDHYMFSLNTIYNHDENFRSYLNGDYDRCPLEIVDHSQIDPTLAPEGKGTLLIMALDSYANWSGLKEDEYKRKKIEVASKLIQRVEKYLPGISKYIEVMEIATPLTMQRFTASPEGAIYGFAQSVNQAGINRLAQKTKIKGLFLAGAWTRPGAGVHGCFVSGIDAANLALEYLT